MADSVPKQDLRVLPIRESRFRGENKHQQAQEEQEQCREGQHVLPGPHSQYTCPNLSCDNCGQEGHMASNCPRHNDSASFQGTQPVEDVSGDKDTMQKVLKKPRQAAPIIRDFAPSWVCPGMPLSEQAPPSEEVREEALSVPN